MDNDEIYDYINSADERRYLREINYRFTSDETAWLISECDHLTLAERHSAWKKVIDTMPDCQLHSPHFNSCGNSRVYMLHETLKKIMEYESTLLSEFFSPDSNHVYQFEIYSDDPKTQIKVAHSCMVFSDYQSCLDFAKNELDDCSDVPVFSVAVYRQCIASDARICVILDNSGNFEVKSCSMDGKDSYDQSDPDSEIPFIFSDLWFCFPSPFQKGDIVWCRNPQSGYVDGPLVLDDTTSMRCAERPGYRGSDSTDMNVAGYYLGTDGMLYYDVNFNYMNYEFYPQDRLTGRERVLKTVSSFLKNRISVDLLVNSYISILLSETAADTEFMCNNLYEKEYLKLSGLKAGNSEDLK